MRTRILLGYAVALILLMLARPWLTSVVGAGYWQVLAPLYITLVTLTLGGLLLRHTRVSANDVYMVGVALLGGLYPPLKTTLSGANLIVLVVFYALALRFFAIRLLEHGHLQKARPGNPE